MIEQLRILAFLNKHPRRASPALRAARVRLICLVKKCMLYLSSIYPSIYLSIDRSSVYLYICHIHKHIDVDRINIHNESELEASSKIPW